MGPNINIVQWQYQLRHERDVTAQTEAVYALEAFPSKTTRKALSDIIKNEHCFYKVGMLFVDFIETFVSSLTSIDLFSR